MVFPVDMLASVAPESLEQSAKDYMSKLLCRNSEIQEYLSILGSKKIEIGLCNVSFVPLYGVDIKQKLLALFSPEEPFKAVGLYLLDQWWSAEDILKTADSSRTGLIKVRTTGERIVLYVLNRIIYRTKEMAGNDVPFLCHGEDEIAKILWKNGEAIGFYSVKPEGRLCKSFLTQRYQLPVMDTIFIRKCHRGNGHGLQMLEDFVDRFKNDFMGLKYPLSPAMYKVCKKYLSRYPEDTELLWEIDGVGSPFQRTQIARKLQAMDLKGNHQALGKLSLETEDIPMEAGFRHVQVTMEHIEVVEEVVQIKITKEMQDTAVTTRGRRSNLKHKKLGEDKEETPGKIIRVEDIEPDVQSADEDGKVSVILKAPELRDTVETMTHDATPISETTHLHCEDKNKLTPEPTHQSEAEKEQVDEITPVMEIQSLKDNVQIMKSFEATIVPVDLQPLELQQAVEVEIVKMSSETEEVKEKVLGVKEMKSDANKVIPLETSEEIVESQKDQTEMADTTNIDIIDEVEMRKISVENIVDDTEVEKEEPGVLEVSLVEKEQVKVMHTVEETDTVQECLCDKEQETEDQGLSRDNEWEKVSSLIQQEEYSNIAYSSGSKGKCGDKRRSIYKTPLRHTVRLRDQAAEGELAERVLRSSSKQTLKTTSKQMYTRQAQSVKQPEKIKQVEAQAECTAKEQQTTDDQNPREVENKMEDSSQDENKMDEMLRNEEQDKMTTTAAEVGKAAEDGEVVEDKMKKKNIEETEVRHDKIEIEENIISKDEDRVSEPTVKDENKIEEAQEEELMKEPNAIQSEEPEINDIELSLDYEYGKDGAQREVEVKVPEPSVAEPFEEQKEEPTLEMMQAVTVQNTEEATSTLKLQKVPAVLVDLDKVSATHTYASVNAKGKSQPGRSDDRWNKEEEVLNQQVEHTEKKQEVEMTENENATVEVVEKIENSSIEETEEIFERVITTDVDRVSELTDENKMEDFQQEKALKETKTVQDTPDEEIKSKDIIESSEDDEEVKSDVQIELSEEEGDKTNFVTPLRCSKRLKHQVAERELTKRDLRSSTKTAKVTCKPNAIKQQVKTKQAVDDTEVEQMKEAVESHTGTAVEKKIESGSIITEGCSENLISALNDNVEEERNVDELHLEEKITDYQNLIEAENKMEDGSQHENKMNTAEIKLEGETLEQSSVEPVEEKDEEPASEMVPKDDVPNTEETKSALKLPKADDVLVDFNKIQIIYTDVSEDAKGTSQHQEEVDLERHRLESTDTESQAEHTEEEQVVELRENETENSSIEGTEEKVVRKCVVSNAEDRVPESAVTDEENMEEVQKGTTAQEIPGEEPKSLHVNESSEDDEGATSDVSLKLTEEEVYKEIITTEGCGENLISALKVIVEEGRNEDEERLGKNVTDAEHLMEMEDKIEDGSQDENKVDTKLRNNEQERMTTGEEVGDTTKDDEKIKAEGKSTSTAESVEEQEEEPASEIEPVEDDDNIKEATSTLKLQNVAVVLVDFNKVPPKHGSDDSEMDKVTSQSQEEVIQELYRPDSTYHINEGKEGVNQTECEVKLGEKEQQVEMIEEEHEETEEVRDERLEIEENIMSKVENKFPESTFTDEKMMNEAQEEEPVKPTNTNQDIPGEEENIQDDIGSSEGLKSDAQIELSEEEEDKTSFVTPLRRSRRLKHQAVESELTKRVLRSSTKPAKVASKTKAVMQQVKTKQPVDDPEEQIKEVLDSNTETAVTEKIESVSITTETKDVKALEGKKPGQSAECKLTKRSLSSLARLTNKATPQQRQERQIKAMMLHEEPEKLDESKNNEMNIILGSEVAVGEHMESETVHEIAEGGPENMISAVQSTCEEGSSLEKTDIEADDHKNIKNIRTSDGNEVENNIRSEDVTEQDKMAPEDIIHGETEQVCTAVHIELSEVLEEVENNVQEEEAATEMAYGEDRENIMETTSTLTLQEASVLLVDIKEVLPNLTGDCSSAFETAQEEMVNYLEIGEQAVDMPEEVKEGIRTEVVERENIETESVNFTEGDHTYLNAASKDTAEEDSSILMSNLENETTDINKLEEANIVLKHGDENKVEEESKMEEFTFQGPILTQDSVLKECSETPTHVHGILDFHNAEVVKNNISIEELATEELALEEDRANVIGSTSMLKLQKAAVMLVDFQGLTGGNEADGNETQSQEVALLTKANEENELVKMDAVEPVTEGIVEEEEAVCMDNTSPKQISKEVVETVFTRYLRRRTVTVTPRRRSKGLTGTRVAELEMDSLVTKVCPDILAVQSTKESRAAVEEAHETNSKCDDEEVPAVSEAVRKDREQDKNIPGNDPEMVEEMTDEDKDMVEAAVDHKAGESTDREILVQGDLPDEYQEKEEPELNQEQVRSANSEQEHNQQDNALEESLLEKTLEEEPSKRMEEKHRVDQSDKDIGVERRALRKRSITTKATSVRKSKRLRKQDQGENDGRTVVWTNTEDSATVMADMKSLAENKTTDQGKGQEIEDTNSIGGEISHKDEDQENSEGEERYENATISQESTTGTEDKSKQAQLSEFLNVSEEATDSKIVAQEENGEENKVEQSAIVEIIESENNAGEADRVTDEPKESEDTQEEPEQIEKNAEEMTEASVTVDENFTLELDEEVDRKDAECYRVVEETKASFQESEKEITDAGQESGVMTKRFLGGRKSATASPEQRSTRRRRRLLQDGLSEMEDKSEAEEVRKVIGEEVKKPKQKRKAVVELTPRRSKRLTGAEIV
ncbi:hypothetical protein AMELA_G00240300 [Ameiurus melas]|uniref:Uncharacterized protein n=1 Tax=Ameiurus melas TaxID=219545 RepID=A0A7J5ZVU2_AMEME|nr:hypothetical protein AMELA_G00240300 [Ameiurus melas]